MFIIITTFDGGAIVHRHWAPCLVCEHPVREGLTAILQLGLLQSRSQGLFPPEPPPEGLCTGWWGTAAGSAAILPRWPAVS